MCGLHAAITPQPNCGLLQMTDVLELVEVWTLLNRQLSQTLRRIPASALQVPCRIGSDEPVTLAFLAQDYLSHLRRHLKQITERTTA